MLRTQAVFLLAATMFGGVTQAAPGDSVPNFNVKAASRALALVPEARIIDLSAGYTLAQNAARSRKAKFRVPMRPRRRIQPSRRRIPNQYNRFRARCLTATMCRQLYPKKMPAMTSCQWLRSGSRI